MHITFKIAVAGQGVFVFRPQSSDIEKVDFSIHPENDQYEGRLHILWNKDIIKCELLLSNGEVRSFQDKDVTLSKIPGAYYWFSLDTQNLRLYAGIGEARIETNLFQNGNLNPVNLNDVIELKGFLRTLSLIKYDGKRIIPMKTLKDPITMSKIPFAVKDTNELSMLDVATRDVFPKSFLSATSQRLYDCIAGKKFVLDDPDFPAFSLAIEYSITTEGCWCFNKLKSKDRAFGYLRITLGENSGESPGVPFVMEIWPGGNSSPIHLHSGADAIIRVLSGSINVTLYPFLGPNVKPFAVKDFYEGDITWISSSLNQTHKLHNTVEKKACITIQCYMYESNDNSHYEYFDYLGDGGIIKHFDPDSDADYLEFREIMKEEWAEKLLKGL
jgi:uncharacterized cupin superfamily protein